MGRPSLAAERREQILDAVTRCVGEYGLEATTLERVADASGFSRGHIRHYVGNREDMLRQFQARLGTQYALRIKEIADNAEPGQRSAALVGFLFGKEWGPADDSSAINAMLWAAARDESVRDHLRSTYMRIERAVARTLRADYPHAPAAECAATAYTLVCLAFGHSTLLELSYPAARQRSIIAVTSRLLDRLASFEPATADATPVIAALA
jgi:AcrR family transcriptional regulator